MIEFKNDTGALAFENFAQEKLMEFRSSTAKALEADVAVENDSKSDLVQASQHLRVYVGFDRMSDLLKGLLRQDRSALVEVLKLQIFIHPPK